MVLAFLLGFSHHCGGFGKSSGHFPRADAGRASPALLCSKLGAKRSLYYSYSRLYYHPTKITTIQPITPLPSNHYRMRNLDRIPDAIIDLESQEAPNVKSITKKYNIDYKTLSNY